MRRPYRMRRILATISWVIIAACSRVSSPSSDDPVASARAFIGLARSGDCERAWTFYTRPSQQLLEERSKKLIKDAPYYAREFAPHNLNCRTLFAEYLPRTAREKKRHGDTAVVMFVQRTGTLFPIPFFSDPIKESPVELAMVHENRFWRVSLPGEPENPYRHEREIGRFTVNWPRYDSNGHRLFQIAGTIDGRGEDIEAVLLDVENWPRWVPHLVEARTLRANDNGRGHRIYGRYQLPGDSASIEYIFELAVSMRTTDFAFKGFGASWRTVSDSLPARRGIPRLTSWGANLSFRADPAQTGQRVQYGYSGLPSEWPPALAARVFRPEYGPEFLSALEREARQRADRRR